MSPEDYPQKGGWPVLTRAQLLDECRRIVRDQYAIGIEPSLRAVYYGLIGEGLIKPDAKEGEGKPADRRRNYRRIVDTIARAKEAGEFPLRWLRDELRIPNEGDAVRCDLDVDEADYNARRWLGELADDAIGVSRWYLQPRIAMLVVEKDAIVGTIRRPVQRHQIPWFCLRGYCSWTGVYAWFQQLVELENEIANWPEDDYPEVVVLYVGDHDPDGMFIPESMQNIVRSMSEVSGDEIPERITWRRVALTRQQALDIGAPSMGVKMSSSRAPAYVERYGLDAWETEAMPPAQLRRLVDDEIAALFDQGVHDNNRDRVTAARTELRERMADPEWAASVLGAEE